MDVFGLMSELSEVGGSKTYNPIQCSSSDCRGTQLIRHGNDGSMLLASASYVMEGCYLPTLSFSFAEYL